jgi:hypothetical protein
MLGAYIRDGLNVVLYLHYVSPLDSRSYSVGSKLDNELPFKKFCRFKDLKVL